MKASEGLFHFCFFLGFSRLGCGGFNLVGTEAGGFRTCFFLKMVVFGVIWVLGVFWFFGFLELLCLGLGLVLFEVVRLLGLGD